MGLEKGAKLRSVFQPRELYCFVQRQEKGPRCLRDPLLAISAGAKEVYVVAESVDDVASEPRGVRQEERNERCGGLSRFDTVRRHRQAHRLRALLTDRFNVSGSREQLRKEDRVPGTPGVKAHAIDLETMLHARNRQSPEADHPLLRVRVDADPVA